MPARKRLAFGNQERHLVTRRPRLLGVHFRFTPESDRVRCAATKVQCSKSGLRLGTPNILSTRSGREQVRETCAPETFSAMVERVRGTRWAMVTEAGEAETYFERFLAKYTFLRWFERYSRWRAFRHALCTAWERRPTPK